MRLSLLIACMVAMYACTGPATPDAFEQSSSDTVVTATLSDTRDSVARAPVATYVKRIPDELNEWYFKVELLETAKRFEYLVRMQYEEVTGEDLISIPNLGKEPKPALRPGKSPYSCIIGFVDHEGKFREYKEVAFKNDRLKMTTLKYYAVTKH